MSDSSIFVVIPNWNGKELLGACLDSLQAQTQKAIIVVVDNGSTDGSQALIKERYPDVQLIEQDKNYGFTGGVNPGIELAIKSGAEYVALFNNDAVADQEWLSQLQAAMSEAMLGIVTSKILLMDKKHLDSTGEGYSIWGWPFPRGRNELDHQQYDGQTEIFAASGGASLYRVSMIKEIGLFDQDFFAYLEDVDISFRAQLAGWQVRYIPSAMVYHKMNATSSKHPGFSRFHFTKNLLLLYAKDMPTILYWKYLPLFMIAWLRLAVGSLLQGKFWPFLKGWLKALTLLPGILVKRRQIQRARKVPVSYIKSMLYHHRPPRPPKLGEL